MSETVNRTYVLRRSTVDMLQEASVRLGIRPSHLVDAMLEMGLTSESEGQWVVTRRPTQWELERIYVAE